MFSSFFLFATDVNHYSRSKCTGSEKPGRKCYFTEVCDYIEKHQGKCLNMLPNHPHTETLAQNARHRWDDTAAIMRHAALEGAGVHTEKRLLGRHKKRNLLSDVLGSPFHSPAYPGRPRGLE